MITSVHRFVVAAGLAVMLAIGTSNKSKADVTLELAYMPIVPCSQLSLSKAWVGRRKPVSIWN